MATSNVRLGSFWFWFNELHSVVPEQQQFGYKYLILIISVCFLHFFNEHPTVKLSPGKTFSVSCPSEGDDAFAEGLEQGAEETQAACDAARLIAVAEVSAQGFISHFVTGAIADAAARSMVALPIQMYDTCVMHDVCALVTPWLMAHIIG